MKSFLLAMLALVAGYLLSYPPVDDAYITFRYAENLARGHGMVYNSGENILGVTTPLWALFLGAGAHFGIAPSILANLLPALVAVLTFWLLARIFLQPSIGSAALLLPSAALLYFPVMVAVFSGMETTIYIGTSCGAIIAAVKRRPYLAGGLCAASCMLRPDGVLALIVVSIIFAKESWPHLVRSLSIAALLLAPWMAYATLTYGSPVPQSIYAKRLLYPEPPGRIFLMIFEGLTQTVPDLVLIVGGLAGILFLARRNGSIGYLLLWEALYVAGLSFSGVRPIFYWYFTPLIAITAVLGWGGLALLYKERFPAHFTARRITWVISLLCLGLLGNSVYRSQQTDPGQVREQAYRQILRDYGGAIPAQARVLLGETGILGYGLEDNYIFDSSGLNSALPFKIISSARAELVDRNMPFGDINRETSWAIKLVQESDPDWIIAPRGRLQLAVMEEQSWFRDRFERLALYAPEQALGIGVYRRR